jgi:hypothetical protein
LWWESPKERDHSEDRGVDGMRMDLGETDSGGISGFNLLRIEAVGGLLQIADEPRFLALGINVSSLHQKILRGSSYC